MEYAILAVDGTILVVNNAWRRVGEVNTSGLWQGVGANYLHLVDRMAGTGNEVAAAIHALLVAVLDGHADKASMDYPRSMSYARSNCSERRWFRMRVERMSRATNVLVSHDDITDHVRRYGVEFVAAERPACRGASI